MSEEFKIKKKFKKIFSFLSLLWAISILFSEAYNNLYAVPILSEVIRAQGFKLLFEIKKDPSSKWRRTFLINKDDLIKEGFISDLNSNTTDIEGASYLKSWCEEWLNSSNWNNLTLWRARRYCTVTLGIEILEEDGVHLIEEKDDSEWKGVFTEFKGIILGSGVIRNLDINNPNPERNSIILKDWCTNKLNQSFTKASEKYRKNVRAWCVKLKTSRPLS